MAGGCGVSKTLAKGLFQRNTSSLLPLCCHATRLLPSTPFQSSHHPPHHQAHRLLAGSRPLTSHTSGHYHLPKQVLRQYGCTTFNATVRSARNELPIHVTSKVLDLSDWTSPRKVEGVGECRYPGGKIRKALHNTCTWACVAYRMCMQEAFAHYTLLGRSMCLSVVSFLSMLCLKVF